MTFRSLILILLFAVLTATTAQEDYRPVGKAMSWGREADGLRMSVWTNPATDKIFGAVRNSSAKKRCYCDPGVNNFAIYVRRSPSSPWQPLAFRVPPGEVTILPVCTSVNLKPGEDMPVYEMVNGQLTRKNYSFTLDLNEYKFPAEWRGRVQAKIAQSNIYCNSPRNTLGEVESPVFEVKLPAAGPPSGR